MKKIYSTTTVVLSGVLLGGIALAVPPIPTGRPIDLTGILTFSEGIADFLYNLGYILAGITIVASGIIYLLAGSSPQKVKTAKDILIAGLIGALILFGAGTIINTVRDFTADPSVFFDGGSSGGATCQGGVRVGQSCSSNGDCPNDMICGGPGEPLCSYSLCM